MQSSHEDLFFSIFLSGCKQPKSIHILFSAAKVRISERNTKLVWEFPSESAFGNSQRWLFSADNHLSAVYQIYALLQSSRSLCRLPHQTTLQVIDAIVSHCGFYERHIVWVIIRIVVI